MKHIVKVTYISKLYCLLVLVFSLTACFPNNNQAVKQEVLLQGKTMGTTYNIKITVNTELWDITELQADIDQALAQVNQEMSTYIPDSELSLFNKNRSLAPIGISEHLEIVIKEALRIGQISNGKLDVTVGPLVNLWGFGPEHKPETIPSDEELAQAQARTGLHNLSLENHSLIKAIPDVYVDLSTIAKGYGVDVIANLLEQKTINNYLVEIGGEMRLKGFKANGTLWHVAIEKPISNERMVHQVVVPMNNAVATSGDYRNYHEIDGQRYSHIIDPHSGKPIDHKLVSVSVIHPSSMTADGLSTAIMVMGPELGLAFAEKHDLAAMLIVKTEDGFEEINTVKFMQYLK